MHGHTQICTSIFSRCHWMRSYKGKQISMGTREKGPICTCICPNAYIHNSSTLYLQPLALCVVILLSIHKNRPKVRHRSRRGCWLYSSDSRRVRQGVNKPAMTNVREVDMWDYNKNLPSWKNKAKRLVVTKSLHPGTQPQEQQLFPSRTAKVLAQPSLCPLWETAARWRHHHKAHLPRRRGQRYMPKPTPLIPGARPTAPRGPDAFVQVGWLPSTNSMLSGGTTPVGTSICSKALRTHYRE